MPGIMDNLILGVGPSRYYYDAKAETYRSGSTLDESHTHILRMMGLVGYALFVWIFISFSKKTLYIYRRAEDYISKEFAMTFMAFIPCMLFYTFTSKYLVTYDIIFIFAAIFACAETVSSGMRRQELSLSRC